MECKKYTLKPEIEREIENTFPDYKDKNELQSSKKPYAPNLICKIISVCNLQESE